MRILITGNKGFIGKHLTKAMIEKGWDVTPFRSICRDERLDVSNPEDWERFGKEIGNYFEFDVIIHLAALLMIDGHSPEDYFRVNAMGTYYALEFARKNGIKKFIHAMTHSDVNKSPNEEIMERDRAIYGTNSFKNNAIPFITSKIAAANMIDAYTREGVINGVNLRLANIRGYGSKDTLFNSFFHQFIAKARKGDDIEVWGNPPKTYRDMIYIRDVVDAFIQTIKYPHVKGWYNIGSGVGLTIEDEIKAIVSVFGHFWKKSKLVYRSDIEELRKRSCVFNIEKAKQNLNWEPKYSYVDGLKDMKKMMEENERNSNNI